MVCTSLETAHAAVVELVHDFAAQEPHFLAPGYSEAQARVDLIDKLWMAMARLQTSLAQHGLEVSTGKMVDFRRGGNLPKREYSKSGKCPGHARISHSN